MIHNKTWLVLGFGLLVVLGFTREFVFEHLNYYLDQLNQNHPNPILPNSLSFFKWFDGSTLFYFKFPMTLLTTGLYFVITSYTLQRAFNKSKVWKSTGITFSVLFTISFIVYLFSVLYNNNSALYYVARRIADIVQSPMIFMLLTLAWTIKQSLPKVK